MEYVTAIFILIFSLTTVNGKLLLSQIYFWNKFCWLADNFKKHTISVFLSSFYVQSTPCAIPAYCTLLWGCINYITAKIA